MAMASFAESPYASDCDDDDFLATKRIEDAVTKTAGVYGKSLTV